MFSGTLLFLCLLHSRMLTGSFAQAEWSYSDPDSWVNDYPMCGGERQSPINILDDMIVDRGFHRSIYTKNYEVAPKSMKLSNDGRTVSLTGEWDGDPLFGRPYLGGGHLRSQYIFERMDIHTGGTDCATGGEHRWEAYGRCGELELIHWNYEARTFENSTKLKNGRVIVSLPILKLRTNDTNNVGLKALGEGMKNIIETGSQTEIKPFALSDFQWDFIRGYKTYEGSMTFPPCEEVVTWLFYVYNLYMGLDMRQIFSSVKLTDGTNNRPTQPAGDRVFEIYH